MLSENLFYNLGPHYKKMICQQMCWWVLCSMSIMDEVDEVERRRRRVGRTCSIRKIRSLMVERFVIIHTMTRIYKAIPIVHFFSVCLTWPVQLPLGSIATWSACLVSSDCWLDWSNNYYCQALSGYHFGPITIWFKYHVVQLPLHIHAPLPNWSTIKHVLNQRRCNKDTSSLVRLPFGQIATSVERVST